MDGEELDGDVLGITDDGGPSSDPLPDDELEPPSDEPPLPYKEPSDPVEPP